ncbi:MAG: DNA-directed RNA polymerase subunit beta [Anaerolineales bacterium]|nr:DNA-directed RNA polymerase subunit beta [Anaerolineales bacterium]
MTDTHELPRLIEVQLDSFKLFQHETLLDLFSEISPIESFKGNLQLFFPGHGLESKELGLTYWFTDPKYNEEECLERDMTYASPLYVKVALRNAETNQIIVQDIFMGDFPLMTKNGTFVINGTERVVVSQLIRSPGVYFDMDEDRTTGRALAMCKLIPDRGAWMEFETRKTDYLTVKFNRKRTIPVTILLRALAAVNDGLEDPLLVEGSDEEILTLFENVDTNQDRLYIPATLRQEPIWEPKGSHTVAQEALIEFYRRMRPGDPPTLDNARDFLEEQLFDRRRYDLERVGRYKLNQRLSLGEFIPRDHRTLTKRDIVKLVERMILINNGLEDPDDIDHLGNRRVKTVGELIQNKLRVGLRRMERVVRERMSIREPEGLTPVSLVNIRPVVAAIREFFGSSQLSQFMEQTNPLGELTHKRTLSALGPGGLRRERAGFEVRDVHNSHYGRICPIETPEGPNIGLIGRLASYGRVNEYGFIETPYRKVRRSLPPTDPELLGRIVRNRVVDPSSGELIIGAGEIITADHLKLISKLQIEQVDIVPFVTDVVQYLAADEEDKYSIAQASSLVDNRGQFLNDTVSCRRNQQFRFSPATQIDFKDVAPRQVVGISAALIPFLEHDDANRALMGSNMQRQAVPLLQPDIPVVSTGMEHQAAYDSGQVITAREEGEVVSVTGNMVVVRSNGKDREYRLRKFNRSNQSTCIDQRPVVIKGQRVRIGDVLADSSSTDHGDLSLGQDVLVAFISWEGGNYEDAILISEQLVRADKFTSIHIEKHEVQARDTKLGPEEITFDIPNVGEEALKDLDEDGIVRIGADVGPNDILVGKITPKGEKELSPEEKLLRAIFGEKAREVKDSSLRMPHGEKGKVVDVRVFTREDHRDLPAGVDKMVRVSVAQKRKITEGDKMAGRHGNKGVISRVVPIADMPFLEDGTPVDIILNPLGVPGRMNIGQILETHLGWAASKLGFRAVTPVFDGATEDEIGADLSRAWLMNRAWDDVTEWAWDWLKQSEIDLSTIDDDDQARILFISTWLADDPDFDEDEAKADENYMKERVLVAWLRQIGYEPDQIVAFEKSKLSKTDWEPLDHQAHLVCWREWLRYVQDFIPRDKGKELPEWMQFNPAELEDSELREMATRVSLSTGLPVPTIGKMVLYDGRSGEKYDQPVTVGIIHMMKLAHLVEDKVHARSTGPYSLVTQQPLGGKAQFGGQRFGEMEVWALQAYGAAHTLQELLTIKSDDVQGRVKAYESIVKGEAIEEPGIPAGFRVLVKELQSLGLAVEAVTDSGEVIRFGKEEDRMRKPQLGTGLLGLAQNERFI